VTTSFIQTDLSGPRNIVNVSLGTPRLFLDAKGRIAEVDAQQGGNVMNIPIPPGKVDEGNGFIWWTSEPGVPNLATWASGPWLINWQYSSSSTQLFLVNCAICRCDSGAAVIQEVLISFNRVTEPVMNVKLINPGVMFIHDEVDLSAVPASTGLSSDRVMVILGVSSNRRQSSLTLSFFSSRAIIAPFALAGGDLDVLPTQTSVAADANAITVATVESISPAQVELIAAANAITTAVNIDILQANVTSDANALLTVILDIAIGATEVDAAAQANVISVVVENIIFPTTVNAAAAATQTDGNVLNLDVTSGFPNVTCDVNVITVVAILSVTVLEVDVISSVNPITIVVNNDVTAGQVDLTADANAMTVFVSVDLVAAPVQVNLAAGVNALSGLQLGNLPVTELQVDVAAAVNVSTAELSGVGTLLIFDGNEFIPIGGQI